MSFLGDLVAGLFGELLGGLLGSKRPPAIHPEGEVNASMATIAALPALLALLLLVLPVLIILQAGSPMDRPAALVGVAACLGVAALGWAAVYLGRKALRVTRRHRGLAVTAVIVGSLSALVSAAGACATLFRLAQSVA